MERRKKKQQERDADGVSHSPPGSVTQQSEDSFPASDSPAFSPGAVGAPVDRHTPPVEASEAISRAEEKADESKEQKKPVA